MPVRDQRLLSSPLTTLPFAHAYDEDRGRSPAYLLRRVRRAVLLGLVRQRGEPFGQDRRQQRGASAGSKPLSR